MTEFRAEWETLRAHSRSGVGENPDVHGFIDRVLTELEDYERSFDLFTKACSRAAEMWRAEKPDERHIIFPDMTKLVVWLLNRLDDIKKCPTCETPLGPMYDRPNGNVFGYACPQCSAKQIEE